MNWGMLGAVLFVSINVSIFIVSLSFDYRSDISVKQWLTEAWEKRAHLAAPVLSAVYDTGTDLGVMILWYRMMRAEQKRDNGIDHIDMEVFFALGVCFMALPRVVTTLGLLFFGMLWKASVVFFFFDFLWLYDLYLMNTSGKKASGTRLQTLHLVEAVCESIPQMILQSIFLVLTSDTSGLGAVDYVLMVASMIASAASITNRLVWSDETQKVFNEECAVTFQVMGFAWRFCQVVTRLCVLSLMYATVGPIYLPVYYVLSLCAFAFFFTPKTWAQIVTFMASPIVILNERHYLSNITPPQVFRRYENFVAFCIIAIFLFIRFDFPKAADSSFRTRNPFAEGLFFGAFICYVFEMVLFVSLLPVVSKKYLSGVQQTADEQATGEQIAGEQITGVQLTVVVQTADESSMAS